MINVKPPPDLAQISFVPFVKCQRRHVDDSWTELDSFCCVREDGRCLVLVSQDTLARFCVNSHG